MINSIRALKSAGTETTINNTSLETNLPLNKKIEDKIIKVKTFLQDPLMDKEPTIKEIEAEKMGENLSNSRFKICDDTNPIAIADINGNFLYEPEQLQFNQVNCLFVAQKTLDLLENLLGHKTKWLSGDEQLYIYPNANQKKSVYSETTNKIKLGKYSLDPNKKTVYKAQSSDIISHEVGHAVLKGIKCFIDDEMNLDTDAFEEAFADCAGMLYNLSWNENCEKIIEETGGDLRKNNRLSMFAEEYGKAKFSSSATYLRNALNNFKYVPSENAVQIGLSYECHDYSTIFSGIFYDIITNLYDKELLKLNSAKNNTNIKEKQVEAIKKTRDILGPIFLKGIMMSPPTYIRSFKDIALSMLAADYLLNKGKNRDPLLEAFIGKELLSLKEVEYFEKELKEIPVLKLEKIPKTKNESIKFLAKNNNKLEINLSELDKYIDFRADTDNRGITTMQFLKKNNLKPKSFGVYYPENEDPVIVLDEGLTLTFDNNGNLFYKAESKMTQNNIDELIEQLKKRMNSCRWFPPTN